ncbi:MAG: hypothetical protein ACO1PB_19855 [Ramlibacter sp.]
MTTSIDLLFGAACFGAVIGWCASLAIRENGSFGIAQLSALIGAVGGGAVAALFKQQDLFSYYSMGLAAAFFCHRFLAFKPVRAYLEKDIEDT